MIVMFISLHALVLFPSHFTGDESVSISVRGVDSWIRNVMTYRDIWWSFNIAVFGKFLYTS